LLKAGGKTLLQHVWEEARKVRKSVTIIATDCKQVAKEAEAFGGAVVRLPGPFETGTHRAAATIATTDSQTLETVEAVVSWQVDEPFVQSAWVERLFELLVGSGVQIGTLVAPLEPTEEYNPNTVKAVVGTSCCQWFSRNYIRGSMAHIGVYGFTVGTLLTLGRLSPTLLSRGCGLEQLAWLEHGFQMHKLDVPYAPLAINSPEDWNQFVELVEESCPSES